MSWNDFNDAEPQSEYDLIPNQTVAKVIMHIKPGGYDDNQKCWTHGLATRGDNGSIYLKVEYLILEGKYAKRKVYGLIGLQGVKNEIWAKMGQSFIRTMLNSARGFTDKDTSPEAREARCINSMEELNGLSFIVMIGVEKTSDGSERNIIRQILTKDHKDYPNNQSDYSATTSTRAPSWS